MTAVELADRVQHIMLSVPPGRWRGELHSLDVPHIHEGMCAFLATALSLAAVEGERVREYGSGLAGMLG